jgi:ribose/xylose/arabinose/galactoside ABC-type transport system permease subunit
MTDQQSAVLAPHGDAPAKRPEAETPGRKWTARLSLGRYTGVVVALLVVAIYLTITEPVFFTWDNIMNIVKANSVIFVLAIGATFVVISGGIDLSTASATTATAMIFGLALKADWALIPALVVTLAFGIALGLTNGILIAKANISFLVVTLGALSIWASFALVVNDGQTVSVFSSSAFTPIKDFVNKDIGPVPMLLVFDVILLLVAGGVLRYTAFGRALFATGSNQEAARLNGISISRVLIAVYAIAGLTAGLAAVVLVGRLTAASATADPTLLLTVLAAVLIGGTSFTGGEGGVLGTVIGVLFLGVVQNGLTLSSVSTFWQGTVSGVILIAAVGLGVLRDRGYNLRQRRAATAADDTAATVPDRA